jgi:peptide deformylase
MARCLIHHAVGVGLAAAIVGTSLPLFTTTAPAGAEPSGEPVVTMRLIEDEPPPPPTTATAEVRMVLIEPDPVP